MVTFFTSTLVLSWQTVSKMRRRIFLVGVWFQVEVTVSGELRQAQRISTG